MAHVQVLSNTTLVKSKTDYKARVLSSAGQHLLLSLDPLPLRLCDHANVELPQAVILLHLHDTQPNIGLRELGMKWAGGGKGTLDVQHTKHIHADQGEKVVGLGAETDTTC